QSTAPEPVVPGKSTNFIVAGMRPDTTYLMRDVLDDGTVSAPLAFTTGSLPTNVTFPTFTDPLPPTVRSDLTQDLVLHMGTSPPPGTAGTLATDLSGHIVWYYNQYGNATSVVPGGTVLGFAGGSLREIDLAGDTVRQTNNQAVNAELAAMVPPRPPISGFNHD